jgi:hypothetical protein
MKFMDRMQEMAERLELEEGFAVISVVPHVLGRELTEEEKARLGKLHLAKIAFSDAIFVVNEGGYIGHAVRTEIEYARRMGKEIMYLEPVGE